MDQGVNRTGQLREAEGGNFAQNSWKKDLSRGIFVKRVQYIPFSVTWLTGSKPNYDFSY